ncbi:unnamed protein product [Owenia fusiformis]|uniref:Uncharacterized protein n=1 Tax=Owenia fusiformis TaxID=6347 RepID=A0A8J1Y7B2_OWEFU|nr:unnamed protein product [Owenia fusiformis]
MNGWHNEGAALIYPATSALLWGDLKTAIVCYIFVVITLSCLAVTVGLKYKERFYKAVGILGTMLVGFSIVLTVTSNGWMVGSVRSRCSYWDYGGREIDGANIGVNVGLHSVNITLKGYVDGKWIYNNERYSWYSIGEIQNEFRVAMVRGTPDAIIHTLGHFLPDEGGLRWGRRLRTAGYYTSALLWTSLACWFLSNLILFIATGTSAWHFMLTGTLMISAVISYCVSAPNVRIAYEERQMVLAFGWAFWVVVVTGSLTFIVGFLLLVTNNCFPEKLVMIGLGDDSAQYTTAGEESLGEGRKKGGKQNGHGFVNAGYVQDTSDSTSSAALRVESERKDFDGQLNGSQNKIEDRRVSSDDTHASNELGTLHIEMDTTTNYEETNESTIDDGKATNIRISETDIYTRL